MHVRVERRGLLDGRCMFFAGCVRGSLFRVYSHLASRAAYARVMSAAKPLVVFVLGGPGAGKGTQCAKIVQVSLGRWCP